MLRLFKKYFVPHAANEHKPHLLRHEGMMLVLAVVILIELASFAQHFIVLDKTKFLAAVLPGALTSLTNEEREVLNVPLLTSNELLNEAARLKAEDMAAKGYFAHTSPDGKTPWYWLSQVGYDFTAAGENLAVNFSESADVTDAWMDSPTHRANIVRKDFKEIGIGVASGVYKGKNTVFVAQFFGTPAAIASAPVPVPTPAPTPKPMPTPKPTPVPTPLPVPSVPPTPVIVTTQVLGEESTASDVRSFIQKVLTTPSRSANVVYGLIALAIILVLLLVVVVKSEVRHPAIIARGALMLSVIVLLFYLNWQVVDLDPELPAANLSANVIIAY